MATHAPTMPRVPFAQLDNSRLQHLASAKNRQNGIFKSATLGKSPMSSAPTKRPALFDDDDDTKCSKDFALYDSENIDPATAFNSAKRSKCDNASSSSFSLDSTTTTTKPIKPFAFTFTPKSSMPPPPTVPARGLATPVRANMSSPRAPLTAPAGRSPKRSNASISSGILKSRRVSAPFSRIDPPSFTGARSLVSSSLPFSLDAALKNSLGSSASAVAPATPKLPGATIQESMPKSWFFDIYEDTPEEEAANLMEHSTLTLDLSSDDEGSAKSKDDRGKENCPPEGYDAPAASRATPAMPSVSSAAASISEAPVASAGSSIESSVSVSSSTVKPNVTRKRRLHVDAMDDGRRTPLSELETESVVLVGKDGDVKGEIIIWEDDSGTSAVAVAES